MGIDIAVGIPTLNEVGTVGYVTQAVDEGLSRYYPRLSCLIINADNRSKDGTARVFAKTSTSVPKVCISSEGRGKGYNVFKFLEYGMDLGAKYFCTVDADLRSITPDWIRKFVEPLLNQSADYVVPVYRRNRYEGNTTNHFCHPTLAAYLAVPVRQPIAGDFSFSRKFVDYVLEQPRIASSYQYGIDIFLTLHAIGGGFSIKEIFLGEKVHNPSFGKMIPMFEQVAGSMLYVLSHYLKDRDGYRPDFTPETAAHRTTFLRSSAKPSEESIRDREQVALTMLKELSEKDAYPRQLPTEVLAAYQRDGVLTGSAWCYALHTIIKSSGKCKGRRCFEQHAHVLTPIYLLRVISFFKEIKDVTAKEVSRIIENEVCTLSALAAE